MFNRIVLIGIIVAVCLIIKVIECFVPGPVILVLLLVILAGMLIHSSWLMHAQRRWKKKLRKPKGLGDQISVLLDTQEEAGKLSNEQENGTSWEPWVDIFIAAKNESRVIESTVRNVFHLDYERFAVWVIDDNSTDNMSQVLDGFKDEFPRLHVVSRHPGAYPGKSAALNEALPLCKGEVIVVLDADANVDPGFLKLVLPVLAPEEVGAVQVQKRLYENTRNLLINCQSSEYAVDTYFQMGRDLIGGLVELRGNGELIKRQALIDVGGWNNKAITDDLDLTMRLKIAKWDIRFCPYAEVWEEGVPTLKALIRQRRRWAEGSIRRYLDYIFPLNAYPSILSIVERLDIMAFATEFTIPALFTLEVISEAISLITGGPVHPRLLCAVLIACVFISQFNYFCAFRLYRSNLSIWESIVDVQELTAYALPLWLPCVMLSFWQIALHHKASPWHPTEHFGPAVSDKS